MGIGLCGYGDREVPLSGVVKLEKLEAGYIQSESKGLRTKEPMGRIPVHVPNPQPRHADV